MGLKLMEKMGWSEGKGLGLKEDGRVENVQARRQKEALGVGAPLAEDETWKSPGTMAAGLNDVLTRLSGVGEVPSIRKEHAADEENGNEKDVRDDDKGGAKRKKKKTKEGGRGFYERRRSRKNVGGYSKDQLREIFGGVDVWALTTANNNVPQTEAPVEGVIKEESKLDNEFKTFKTGDMADEARYEHSVARNDLLIKEEMKPECVQVNGTDSRRTTKEDEPAYVLKISEHEHQSCTAVKADVSETDCGDDDMKDGEVSEKERKQKEKQEKNKKRKSKLNVKKKIEKESKTVKKKKERKKKKLVKKS